MNLVVGKFYPPHEGHHYVIDQALADGPTLVAIMWSAQETIRPGLRKRWIRDAHDKYLWFAIVKDELPVDFDDSALSRAHAVLIDQEIAPYLGRERIDQVFGSEVYVEHLAEYFDAEPVYVDPPRQYIPVSASQIREDPRTYWNYLRGPARAGLCKRIVCVGAESCGTTTLARELAAKYGTVWVPEYGRTYSEGMRDQEWTAPDLSHIASAQVTLENSLARHAENGILICDTNTLATRVWEEFLVGPSKIHPDPADLFILTGVCPWEDDGLRFGRDFRHDMQEAFRMYLDNGESPWIEVTGSREERLRTACEAIDQLTWTFGEPKG